jgi:hypothetical protein
VPARVEGALELPHVHVLLRVDPPRTGSAPASHPSGIQSFLFFERKSGIQSQCRGEEGGALPFWRASLLKNNTIPVASVGLRLDVDACVF